MIDFKGSHFERDIILWGVRWYVAYPISYRQLEEMMEERGVEIDHSTVNRWVLKMSRCWSRPFIVASVRWGQLAAGRAYVRIKGKWKYLCRAVDKAGDTVDFLLTAKRDRRAALRFFAQSDRPSWRAREDHDRQERRQRRGDRKLQQGA